MSSCVRRVCQWRDGSPRWPDAEPESAQADPLQRLRHELRRPPVLRDVAPPATTRRGATRTSPTGPSSPSCSSAAPSTASSSPTCSAPTTSTAAPTRPRSATARRCRSTTRCCSSRRWRRVTEHLGFGITAGTAYEHPYPFARRMSTLDHLTNGPRRLERRHRLPAVAPPATWATTTSSSTTTATTSPTSTSRCSTSCGRGRGRTTRSCATASPACSPTRRRCTRSGTAARTSRCPGIHLSEPSTQRTPVIYQAGRVAARHPVRGRQRRGDLRRRARRRPA